MAKHSKNSAWMPAPRKHATLEHWVGPTQHVGDGVSSDPVKKDIPKGTLKSKQYLKDEFRD